VLVDADVVDEPVDELVEEAPPRRLKRPSAAFLLEVLLVLASPVVLFFVLRLRAMAPLIKPDPAMSTIYIIDPRDFFARYSLALATSSGTREGARVGFLVPARLSYLLFGAMRGFFVFRYVLALVAVVPSYMLLRRLYNRAAGAIAVIIVMSSPVLVNAWGTDYTDSAVVSYLVGGLACLAMPCRDQRRPAWLAIAGGLFTAAVWANIDAAPLVGVTMVVYFAICLLRTRRRFLLDALVLAGAAVVVTGGLMLASGWLLGPFDFIGPTRKALTYLDSSVVVKQYYSTNPRWILLRPYLLVPAAVVGAWGAVFVRRLRAVPTPQLLIGLSCVAQIAVFVYLQFLNHAEVLEEYYYSSSLWPVVCLTTAITVAALAKPLNGHPVARWLPAGLVLAVPLVYELDPNVSPFGWVAKGLVIAAIVVAAAAVGRLIAWKAGPVIAGAAAAVAVVVVVGLSLVLTVAPYEVHAPLWGVSTDPLPRFAGTLGGTVSDLIDQYRVATELPKFVGNSTYPDEQLLMWYPPGDRARILELIGMYHAAYNSLPGWPTSLTPQAAGVLLRRRPAEILVFDSVDFSATLQALAPYEPTLLRATVLKSGTFTAHAWLVWLGAYGHTSLKSGA
jgi:hypothetical protein